MKQVKLFLVTVTVLLCNLTASGQTIYYNLYSTYYTAGVKSGSIGYSGDITIPSMVYNTSLGYTVTSIEASAFANCENLNSVSIPYSVISIGSNAFYSCSSLTFITIPKSAKLASIGNFAFRFCSSLTTITIPENVTSIGNYAFEGCSGLTSITSAAVTPPTIGNSYTFNGVDKSIPVYVPAESVDAYKSAEYWSEFTNIIDMSEALPSGYCGSNLTWVLYPDGELIIEGTGTMTNYTQTTTPWYSHRTLIKKVKITEGVTSIGNYAFVGCSSLTSITIPEGVTSIGSYAFVGCSNLTSITIPESVTSIGSSAFDGCTGELTVNCNIPSVSSESSAPFYNSKFTKVTIGDKVTSIGVRAFYNCSSLTSITIPESVTLIGSYAFYYCSSLASITIPESVTSIESYAFNGCSSLKKVIIEDGSTTLTLGYNYYSNYSNGIGSGLFFSCPLEILYLGRDISYNSEKKYGYSPFYNQGKLTSVTIGDKVTWIRQNTFDGCTGELTVNCNIPSVSSWSSAPFYYSKFSKVSIGEEVTSIGNYAFYNCSSLTSVHFNGNSLLTSIGNDAFYNCSSLTSITIPESVTSIGSYAFSSCTSLPSITIPESVTSIGNYAFEGCSSLTSITISDGVTSIGDCAFSHCSSLTAITIPESVTGIGNSAFYNCSSLTSVHFNEKSLLASIESSAFRSCSSLASITIPASVTSIESYAFEGCSNLTSIIIPESVTSIGSRAFKDCSSLTSAVIGNGITSIPSTSFSGCINIKELTIGSSVSTIDNSVFADCADLEYIYALNSKAIVCDESIFAIDAYNNATLYVPEGRDIAYSNVSPWSKFYDIRTMAKPVDVYDVKIGSAGYATLYLDYAVERPRGVEAYYISHVAGNAAIMKAVWDYIPANTGVILRGAKGTYTFTSTTEDVEPISENLLRGTTVDKEIRAQSNTTYYALGRVDGVVGLYRAELENGYFFNNANKAYLVLTSETEEDDDEGQLARSFILRFPDGTATSMAEVMSSDENDDEVIYDLQGRRLTEITAPGLYIINGKKVWR